MKHNAGNKHKHCFNLRCQHCGMEIMVKSPDECPGKDIMFVCCGESMKRQK
jgi:hypothetical protein